jgi:hypothetical protein
MTKRYVRRVGSTIHDIHDNPFLLKGVGIGGWLLLEGYMVQSYNEIDRPRRFHQHIAHIVGTELTDYFFEKWYRLFFTKDDITRIKACGFNSIRIPIDYQFLYTPSTTTIELESIKDHFDILNNIIQECAKHEIYIILDMHAAPGGQTGTNIDNSLDNQPELFTNPLYANQLCYVWKDLAFRYKDEPYIAAYDLLNEPLPEWFSQYNNQLMPLYERVIKQIRQVDSNHMITIEGLHWSTDWSCFTHIPDDNILLQFHKYWSNPDQESIQPYLDIRDKFNVPIFMGEGGENNLLWYASVFTMYEQLDISYNFWTYKKMANHNSIVSFDKPPYWNDFLEHKLTPKETILLLQDLLRCISNDCVIVNHSVVNHILRQHDFTIPAYAYDYFGRGTSYSSTSNHPSSMRKNDCMHVTNHSGAIITPNFKQYSGEDVPEEEQVYVTLHKDEWVEYSIPTTSLKLHQIDINSTNNTAIKTTLHSQNGTTTIRLTALNKVLLKQISINLM